MKKHVIFIVLIISLSLLIGCTTTTGQKTKADGDLDWALDIATQVVEDSYGSGYFIYRFYAENIDREGFLDEGYLFPVWTFYLSKGENHYLRIRIRPDGDYFLSKYTNDSYPEEPLIFTYNANDVRRWIGIASESYRRLGGLGNDVNYSLACYGGDEDRISIGLYDSEYNELGMVRLDAQTGDVTWVEIYE